MTISDFHASHIRRVGVGFIISAPDLEPNAVTTLLGLEPASCARRGDPRKNAAGQSLAPEKDGWWRLESVPHVESKDINAHFEYLLEVLLPHREALLHVATNCETFFDVLWESTYLYAGTGPLLSSRACEGIGHLKAGMGFDIYQLDDEHSA